VNLSFSPSEIEIEVSWWNSLESGRTEIGLAMLNDSIGTIGTVAGNRHAFTDRHIVSTRLLSINRIKQKFGKVF
jgi:hypothetical protein